MFESTTNPTYQGQFGPFTIDDHDRREVILYRTGLALAAGAFSLGTTLVLTQPFQPLAINFHLATACFWLITAGLGLSLWTIHIYLVPLHRTLQIFWAIGTSAALYLSFAYPGPLVITVYDQPWTVLGIGFTFAALTGIFFKEAFCFNRLETKFLTAILPLLLLGHLAGILPVTVAKEGLTAVSILFLIFVLRKAMQPIDPDIGDKSVFTYLAEQRKAV
ncbi:MULTISPECIES: DUF2301 domain-containing membrane protein [unclassified Synechocystis]|uniref:DUF2301 domain-containing membrane protein n=1 Tax=unclassified Synechocystis TaxID=2640012 RepID=UPI000424CF31|nr:MULTISPECIES: DUF2301 domain-containing membrane protein [unclassified Synechocystis]AIE73805.1 Permeases of the major facilitator superfamily [Synechocystis sp. PCC 6714]MCT0252373.1 DUF2301 domain-containing membrane protein [Synechocystis sp. CS-94]